MVSDFKDVSNIKIGGVDCYYVFFLIFYLFIEVYCDICKIVELKKKICVFNYRCIYCISWK